MRHAIVGITMPALLAAACQAPPATGPDAGDHALPPVVGEPSAPAQSARRSFTVVATGEILSYDRLGQALGQLRPLISGADLAICHLETPLAPARGPYPGRPPASVPPQLAPALAGLGYDTCSTASEHALDTGPAGLVRTLEALDQAGLRHSGTARSAAEAATPTIVNVHGARVAHLSYTYGVTGTRLPKDKPWLANRIDPERILAGARQARQAGAQVVILSMHWGEEGRRAATPKQIALAQQLLAANEIDLIVGHHVDVVQPFGQALNGKYVAYGMGSLIGPRGRDEGLLTRFTFTHVNGGWAVTRAEFVPTFIDRGPAPRVLNVPAALADPTLSPDRRVQLQGVLRRSLETVYSRSAYPILTR